MNVNLLVLNTFTHDARVHKEAKTLTDAGYNVTVIALWKPGLPQTETKYGYQIQRIRLKSIRWQGGVIVPLVKYIEFALRVHRFAKQHPADIYHANDSNTLPSAWLAARRNKTPFIYDAHELETGRNFKKSRLASIYGRLWALPEKLLIHKAHSVITVSKSIAQVLADIYDIPLPTVIMNCPETQALSAPVDLHAEFGINPAHKIALYQGGITAGRGIEVFIEAVQLLPNVTGLLLGNGTLHTSLQQKIQSGKYQRIHLPGAVPQKKLLSYTAGANIGIALIEAVCKSYYYSLPNKLFEYIHAGIPVIGSNLPEIASIIQQYNIGSVVDPTNVDSIANAIQTLLEDENTYQEAKTNTALAANHFNWENESEKLLNLYQQVSSYEKNPHTF